MKNEFPKDLQSAVRQDLQRIIDKSISFEEKLEEFEILFLELFS